MAVVFVNLKRFDIPRALGGICPLGNPEEWIRTVIRRSVELGLGSSDRLELVFILPEALIIPATNELTKHKYDARTRLHVGCQSVFREDVSHGGNFGAFTSNLPAAAAVNSGASWAMVGHSEERRDKLEILAMYDSDLLQPGGAQRRANETVDRLMNAEALRALESGLDVLICMGETADERGEGSFEEQKPRVRDALERQVRIGLQEVSSHVGDRRVVVGYEPIWAIGPGKTPPGAEYIDFAASSIKELTQLQHGFRPDVVYGGGLKKENAGMLARVKSIDGGLVALTRFSDPIGFDPGELAAIIETYRESEA